MNDEDLVCLQPGRWHRTWKTMADCERSARYTMQSRDVRADHSAQLRKQRPGGLVVVPTDMRELT